MIKTLMAKQSKKAKTLEKKLQIYNAGYEGRALKLAREIGELATHLEQSQIDLNSFTFLRDREVNAIPRRIEELTEEVNQQKEREIELQKQYANLVTEKENLQAMISSLG
eukprot:TRINITY_DN8402_c0_g1_i1.p1 TRINITY_DN8402_c0_g1~~TRINITY_DN8402_c0_g1_i1.p1  ORF type:complete len:110 (-),score=40.42 TRINITY_DN8402_c0_g1_i1:1-330(-)